MDQPIGYPADISLGAKQAMTATQAKADATASASVLMEELAIFNSLILILEDTWDQHVNKISPVIADIPTSEDTNKESQYRSVWASPAGSKIRSLEERVEYLTDRIARTTRNTEV